MGEAAQNLLASGRETETTSPADEQQIEIDVLSLLRQLRSGKRTILQASFAGLLLAAAIAFLLRPQYTSTVSFIPPGTASGNSMASAFAGQLSAMGAGDLLGGVKNTGDLYAGILRSRSIAGDIVRRFDLMHEYGVSKESQAESILNSKTSVIVDVKSSIVEVDVSARSPKLAHDIANAYMDSLRETDGRLALSQSSQQRVFFGQQLEKEKDALEDAEVELKKTEEQSGLIAPTGQTAVEIQTIAETRAQVAVREVQLAALRQSSTDANPDVIRLQSEIGDLRGQLSRLQNGGGNGSASAIPASKVPELQLEYVRKEREVKYHEALFDMLSRQYETARLDEAREAPLLQMLDPASYPDAKSSPKRLLIMTIGLFLGFFLSCIWVLVRDPLRGLRASLDTAENT